MLIFAKLGNVWPMDYLATLPRGEIKRFRLRQRNIYIITQELF